MRNENAAIQGISGNEPQAPVRVGVIGAGWFASRRHLPDIQANEDAVLSSICRRSPEERALISARFEIAPDRAFEDWRRMLDEASLDAVLIATPNNMHYAQAKAALERGLHVLVEKPMTIHSRDAWDLVDLAQKRGLQLAVALNPPFWAHCHRIRHVLQDEIVGRLESVSMYWTGSAEYVFGRSPAPTNLPGIVPPTMYRADPEQNGGGYFADGGPHLISELVWTTGRRVRQVACLMDTTPSDMRISVSFVLDNGAMANIVSLGDSRHPERRVRNVFGASGGTIEVSGFTFETAVMIPGKETEHFREADLPPVASPVANFIDAILGRSPLFSPGTHGAHVVEIVEAAYESASTGRAITLAQPV